MGGITMKNLFLSKMGWFYLTRMISCRTIIVYFLSIIASWNISYGKWQQQSLFNISPDNQIFSICIVDTNIVWAVIDTNIFEPPIPKFSFHFLRTIDGGNTWTTGNVPDIQDEHLNHIFAMDADTAWICTNNGYGHGNIYKTSNGGSSWKKQLSIIAFYIHFFDKKNGLLISYPLHYTTTDGGETWLPIPVENFPPYLPGEFFYLFACNNFIECSGDTLWYGSTKGRVYRTTNRGYNWSVWSTSLEKNANINSIAFMDGKNGIAISCIDGSSLEFASNKMARTRDGGETWTTISAPDRPMFANITHVPGADSTFFVTSSSDSGALYGSAYSIDFGKTWITIDSIPHNAIAFASPTYGWTSGMLDSIHLNMFKWKDSTWKPTSIRSDNNSRTKFHLCQNYPNPFNATTNINYQVTSSCKIDLSIYNLLGHKIKTLVNRRQAAGNYSVIFEGNGLVSGLYFYVLKTDVGFVETKKFILLKSYINL